MNIKDILTAPEDENLFLLGNEAAVRGALESGVTGIHLSRNAII